MFERFKVEKRLTSVEIDVAELRRRVTSLEVQWGDTLDRIKTMMSRLRKQQVRDEQAGGRFDEPAEAEGSPSPLSERQRIANERILAMRARGKQ